MCPVFGSTTFLTWNLVHLARIINDAGGIPAHGDQRRLWNAGCRFDRADLRAGHRRYNFVWFRVADAEKLREMCTDDQGEHHEFGVPPPLVRSDLVAQMRAEAEALLPLQCHPDRS